MMGDLSDTIIDGDPFDINEGGESGGGFDPTSLPISTNIPADVDEIITGESGGTWVRKTLIKMKEYFSTLFTGATDLTNGTQGELPAPLAGQQNATLFGDGSWKTLLYDALSRYENAVTGRSYTYSGDLNDIMQNCIVNTDGSNANRPSGTSNWGFVVTLMHSNSANYATQIYVTMNEADASKNMFFRDKNNGTWQSWKRLLTENDLTSINTAIGNKQDKLTNPLTQSDVVNNLTSTSTVYPLSAAQGKILNDKISNIGKVIQGSASFSAPSSRNNYNLTLPNSLLAGHFYLLFLSVHVQWWQTAGSGASCTLRLGTHIVVTHDASATTPDGTTVTDIGCYTPSSNVNSIPYEIWQGSGSNKNLTVLFTAIQLT